MKDGKTESSIDFAEGLPPAPPFNDVRPEPAGANIRVNEPTAMQVFFAWEKLRVLYNTVLIVVTIVKLWVERNDWGLEQLIPGALLANVLYCAGPVAEGYLCWLGLPRSIARRLVFGLGMALAIAATVVARQSDLQPPFH